MIDFELIIRVERDAEPIEDGKRGAVQTRGARRLLPLHSDRPKPRQVLRDAGFVLQLAMGGETVGEQLLRLLDVPLPQTDVSEVEHLAGDIRLRPGVAVDIEVERVQLDGASVLPLHPCDRGQHVHRRALPTLIAEVAADLCGLFRIFPNACVIEIAQRTA